MPIQFCWLQCYRVSLKHHLSPSLPPPSSGSQTTSRTCVRTSNSTATWTSASSSPTSTVLPTSWPLPSCSWGSRRREPPATCAGPHSHSSTTSTASPPTECRTLTHCWSVSRATTRTNYHSSRTYKESTTAHVGHLRILPSCFRERNHCTKYLPSCHNPSFPPSTDN